MDSDAGVVLAILLFLGLLVGLIALGVYLIKKSGDQTKHADMVYAQMLQRMPQDKQMMFAMQYNNSKKSSTTAVLLALFLGGLGAHKFYMGQTGMGILYLVFCWTYIPSIIAFIEAFTIAGQVAKYNEQKMMEFSAIMSGANPYFALR